jgi:hypothetical protein
MRQPKIPRDVSYGPIVLSLVVIILIIFCAIVVGGVICNQAGVNGVAVPWC